MKRRDFIQLSSASLLALLAKGCEAKHDFEIEFLNDMPLGHLVFESHSFQHKRTLDTEYLIVGGGIAGMSAAYQLRNKNFMLFEASNLLGGTSAGTVAGEQVLCHGAHYDLEYPANYGAEVLAMLRDLGIVSFNEFSNSWTFVDQQYLIPKNKESRVMDHGTFRNDVLPNGQEKAEFYSLLKPYYGKMPMPTRLIDQELHHLNTMTFGEWLRERMTLTPDFVLALDYHMKDDYGAGADVVSALAGIHYFTCRPYRTRPVQLFSPPQGNYYFIQKMYDHIPEGRIYPIHVVKKISGTDENFQVDAIDGKKREVVRVHCKKIIYAGNKHALKYIYPEDYRTFENNEYAPWVVVNVLLKKDWGGDAFWQNEIISEDQSLLGFVDSRAQHKVPGSRRVLTAYYCFKPEERLMMSLIEERKSQFVEQVLQVMEDYFDQSLKNIVEKVYIKQMGHAMPIPKTDYLFQDANMSRSQKNLIYAGVDVGRLPLLFEAMDSGISAAEALK